MKLKKTIIVLPPPCTCSRSTNSIFVLSEESVFLACSLRCSYTQKHNQYVPLKITCIIELNLILLKTISFRLRQIAQQIAATPTQISCLIWFGGLFLLLTYIVRRPNHKAFISLSSVYNPAWHVAIYPSFIQSLFMIKLKRTFNLADPHLRYHSFMLSIQLYT